MHSPAIRQDSFIIFVLTDVSWAEFPQEVVRLCFSQVSASSSQHEL